MTHMHRDSHMLTYLGNLAEVPERSIVLICEACQIYWGG